MFNDKKNMKEIESLGLFLNNNNKKIDQPFYKN